MCICVREISNGTEHSSPVSKMFQQFQPNKDTQFIESTVVDFLKCDTVLQQYNILVLFFPNETSERNGDRAHPLLIMLDNKRTASNEIKMAILIAI